MYIHCVSAHPLFASLQLARLLQSFFEQIKQILQSCIICGVILNSNWSDGVVVRASALLSVDLGFIYQVE